LLHGVDGPDGHLWGGVPVVVAHGAAPLLAAATCGFVAHQLVNDAGRDTGILQPSGVGMPKVMGAVQIDCFQQWITDDRDR
jgi:hypothetical protein